MAKLKVLEVIRQGQIGGGESHLLDLINFLDKGKVDPICLSFSDGEMVSQLREKKIVCYVIETNRPFDLNVQNQIIRLIKDEKIQLVHAHGSRAASNVLYPVHNQHIPFIYTVHGWSFHDDQAFLVNKFRVWCEKLICHYANQVICVSQSNKDTGIEAFGLNGAMVIENGIDLERFNPNAAFNDLRKEFGFSSLDFVVGFIARCTFQKNPIIFLEAIRKAHAQNPQIKGLFIGEGEMDAKVDAFIQHHHMLDYICRFPFRTDVPDLLHCIDVYCLPSLWEGLSIALLEAMAMGKPIIATPTDGTKELLQHEKSGLVVPFNDADTIVEAINRFCVDRQLMITCAKTARLYVEERFNAQRVADAVMKIYLHCFKDSNT